MNLNIAFLASHNGSNVRAILDHISHGTFEAIPKVIITNNPEAGVLHVACDYSIPSVCLNEKMMPPPYRTLDDALVGIIRCHGVNLIVLAGYMKKVPDKLIDAYPDRILNIHPSLLPKYGGPGIYGDKVHEAVLASKDEETGATVHVVNKEYDKGRILAQHKIKRYPDDTVEKLSARVRAVEYLLYTAVLKDIQQEKIILD